MALSLKRGKQKSPKSMTRGSGSSLDRAPWSFSSSLAWNLLLRSGDEFASSLTMPSLGDKEATIHQKSPRGSLRNKGTFAERAR